MIATQRAKINFKSKVLNTLNMHSGYSHGLRPIVFPALFSLSVDSFPTCKFQSSILGGKDLLSFESYLSLKYTPDNLHPCTYRKCRLLEMRLN